MRRHDKRNKPRSAHVRHILVGHKPEARELIEQIANAKNPLRMFKKLAKKYSNCPSGAKKGDLGEFVEGQMAIDFEKAVWARFQGFHSSSIAGTFCLLEQLQFLCNV